MSALPLTDAERVDARRFMGYPSYGPGASGFQGWRFFEAYGVLEYRLTNAADAELVVIRSYLTQCAKLEQDVLGSADNLDTDQAAVWHRNKYEVRDRQRLLDDWRRRLCFFLGIPPGEGLSRADGGMVI